MPIVIFETIDEKGRRAVFNRLKINEAEFGEGKSFVARTTEEKGKKEPHQS